MLKSMLASLFLLSPLTANAGYVGTIFEETDMIDGGYHTFKRSAIGACESAYWDYYNQRSNECDAYQCEIGLPTLTVDLPPLWCEVPCTLNGLDNTWVCTVQVTTTCFCPMN